MLVYTTPESAMQTIWNRVAQAGNPCGCASCLFKISRPNHIANSAVKRPGRYLTSSTLLYSGIFAAAATTDAHVKKQRRLQWDDAIAAVQHELAVSPKACREECCDETGALNDESGLNPLDALFEHVKHGREGAIWAENTGRPFDQKAFPPQSIYATANFRQRHRRLWTAKKLHLTGLNMDKLLLRSLLWLDKQDLLANILTEDFSPDFGQLIMRPRSELELLLSDLDRRIRSTKAMPPTSRPEEFSPQRSILSTFIQDPQGDYLQEAYQSSKRLIKRVESFQKGENDGTHLLLGMLDEITRSSAPPRLKTMSIFIDVLSTNGFNPHLTELAIRALRASHYRVDERNMVSILNHYTRTNNYPRFCHYIEAMQGMHGGMHLARDDIAFPELAEGRLFFEDRFGKTKLIQKHTPNPHVFSAVIKGMLHFKGFEGALGLCEKMGEEGWGLSMRGMTPLLRDCARRADWTSGLAIWHQIRQVQAKSYMTGKAEKIQSWTYATMLRLCQVCKKDKDYGEILIMASKARWKEEDLMRQIGTLARRDEHGDTPESQALVEDDPSEEAGSTVLSHSGQEQPSTQTEPERMDVPPLHVPSPSQARREIRPVLSRIDSTFLSYRIKYDTRQYQHGPEHDQLHGLDYRTMAVT